MLANQCRTREPDVFQQGPSATAAARTRPRTPGGLILCLCQSRERRLTVPPGDLAALHRMCGPVTAGHSSCYVRDMTSARV
jgi:hypothetical protein